MDATDAKKTIDSIMKAVLTGFDNFRVHANRAGEWVGLLGIRLFLAYEYGDSGMAKWNGQNWFSEVQGDFPFPFNVLPDGLNWFLATWSELLGAVALVVGLATRFFSISLFILTIVAWVSVHASYGYNVCDSGYKLALIFTLMFIPLILSGPGKLSLDHLLLKRSGNRV
jgi:putative oxidoreductase